jgi:hypothetical protein
MYIANPIYDTVFKFMMKDNRIAKVFIILMMMTASSSLMAQMPFIKVEGETKPGTVFLKKIDINVEIIGNVATTAMKMVFQSNNRSRVLEGELTFPMPEGVAVSRYALDIDGTLREAVPVSKAKATEVFESIERRQIDPGLLERIEGNNFRTRIYPLAPGRERTVLIAYEESLTLKDDGIMRYHLPLDCKDDIAEFSLSMKVYQAAQKPQLIEQPDGSFSFSKNGSIYEASMHRTNYRTPRSLTVNLPEDTDTPQAILQANSDGSHYFLIHAYQESQPEENVRSDRVGIIWDNSLSGLQRDTEKELALLDMIIKRKRNLTVDLGLLNVTFDRAGSFEIRDGDWSALETYLRNIVYDGGTDFSRLNDGTLSAGEYLLFTDGMSTFGENAAPLDKPVYVVTSSIAVDYSALKAIIGKAGGKTVSLANTSVEEACRILSHDRLQFLGIREASSVSEVYPSAPVEMNGSVSVAGIALTGTKEVTLLFGRNGKVERSQKIQLDNVSHDVNVGRIWAQKKIAELDVRYERNRDDIELLGKQFGIVTRNTSLIVLENVSDYVRYEIVPPAELLPEYNRLLKEQASESENRTNDMPDRVIAAVNDLKAWWNTSFAPAKKPAMEDESRMAVDIEEMEVLSEAPGFPQAKRDEPSAPAKQLAARIELPDIRSDRDYMQQILSAGDAYSAYLSLRGKYLGTPGFYFDVSDFFYRNGQKETGLLVLSSLADLVPENAELFKTLAYRLKEKGEYARELFVAGKVREWRPVDLQSHRDYALALQDNGRYQEALDCMYGILNAPCSPEMSLINRGIEEVLACEINNLVSLHREKLNLSGIDSRIIADLPVDVRVVLNWNRANTDIDLWITDPAGEQCMYSHNRTAAGGRLSGDFTEGFGPEQFLLKKALSGTYLIEADFYGERQLTLSGPTTVMGEICLSYSDKREERRVITFQYEKQDGDSRTLIGKFIFQDTKQPDESGASETSGLWLACLIGGVLAAFIIFCLFQTFRSHIN